MVEMGAGHSPIREGQEIEGRKIVEPIGVGGFGIVYAATNLVFDRKEAVKEFFPRSVASRTDATAPLSVGDADKNIYEALYNKFSETSKLLARLKHPNIVHVYDYAEANSTAYMFMEFVEGKILRDWRNERDGLPTAAEFRQVFRPVMDALAYLHEKKMFHRDVAPDNIMIEAGTGRPVLIDFGTVRQEVIDEQGRNPNKVSSIVVGKLEYSPQEQLRLIKEPIDAYTDIFSLAATMYEFVCGVRAPRTEERLAAKSRPGPSARDSYEPVAGKTRIDITEAECAAIDRAMELWPESRFQSIAEMMEAMGWTAASSANAETAPLPPREIPASQDDPKETAEPEDNGKPEMRGKSGQPEGAPDAGAAGGAGASGGAGGSGNGGGQGGAGPSSGDGPIGGTAPPPKKKRSALPYVLVLGTAAAVAGVVVYHGLDVPDPCANENTFDTARGSKAGLQDYIGKCPSGAFIQSARSDLRAIERQEQLTAERQEYQDAVDSQDVSALRQIANTSGHSQRSLASNELKRIEDAQDGQRKREEQERKERRDFEYTSGLTNNRYEPLRAYLRKYDSREYSNSTYAKVIRDKLSSLSASDRSDWQRAQRSNREEDYEYYLDRYPEGQYRASAESRLEALATPPPATACNSPGLTQTDIASQGSQRIKEYYSALDRRDAYTVVSMWSGIDNRFAQKLQESAQNARFASSPDVYLAEYRISPPYAAFRVDVSVGDSKNPSGVSYQLRVELSCIVDEWRITKLKNWP